MNGGKVCEGEDQEGQSPTAQVPIGWQRQMGPSGVVYISPSGSVLSCLEQVKTYLLTDGTCKCGLECPLILPKVFNFDPGAAVRQRTTEDAKADEDVTKLCIHKRKIIAVATLHKSMESPHPSVVLTGPGGGTNATPMVPTRSATPRAIRNKLYEGLPNSASPDSKNSFKMMMTGQRHYQQDLSVTQQQEFFSGYPAPRLGSSEHEQKSPYRSAHCGMLSPAASGPQVYGDGSASPRTDPLGSPDAFARGNPGGFHIAGSPGSIHGNHRTPLSPASVLLHGSPAAQPSCAMAGRTNFPLSPTVSAKSPIMKKPMCNFGPGMDMSRAAYHLKPQPGPHPPPPPPLPPSCALQKKQMTSEKDPLGILDPIPSKPVSQTSMVMNPSNFQPNIHSQVPMMNVNIPPAIVPLPSNLPLPTVKPGPVNHSGHAHRVQHAASVPVSPSPVTSPVHMTGPAMARMEASPQRSRSSSTSSEHGGFIMPSGHQVSCGSMKVPPRSPRSSMGSPRPSMPSSPSTKPDALHQYKDIPSQLLGGVNSVLGSQPSSMLPPVSTGNAPQKNHPGLLGMPLNQILNQHNAASFPASSLLSAAAKAQLANQNKLTGNSNSNSNSSGVGSGGGSSTGDGGASGIGHGGNPGSVGYVDGHSTLNPMFPPNPGMLAAISEGQSGRAVLRDKLMAQQRDPLRKRKPSSSNHNSMVFNMLKSQTGGSRLQGPPDHLRKAARQDGLHPNNSMAQLLQSMSCQSSHIPTNNGPACMGPGPTGPGQPHFGEGAMPSGSPQQSLQVAQRAPGGGDGLHCQSMDGGLGQVGLPPGGGLSIHGQYTGLANPMQSTPMANCGVQGQGGHLGNPALGHPNSHLQQLAHHHQTQMQGHPHARGRAIATSIAPNSNGDSCSRAISERGDASSLNCGLNNPQLANLRSLIHNSQRPQRHGQPQPVRGLQGMQRLPRFQGPHPSPQNPSPNPMACLFQNFQIPRNIQVSLPENISGTNKPLSTQPSMTFPESLGMKSLPHFQEGLCDQQAESSGPPPGQPGLVGLPGSGGESVGAIYRAVVDAASKGAHVVITSTVGGTTHAGPAPGHSTMSAFAASVREPVNLPHAVSAVIHGCRGSFPPEAESQSQPQPHPPRGVRPRKNSEQGKCTPEGGEALDHFRSPGRGTPRRQWEGEVPAGGAEGFPPWRGDEFLECSTHVRSSPRPERLCSLAPSPAGPTEPPHEKHHACLEDSLRFNNCKRTLASFKEHLEPTLDRCTHMNGALPPSARGYGDVLGPPRQDLMADNQSPSSSTSLEGPLAKDYIHYNGHYNGCAPSPSDTKSLSSEEDLRQPDSPSSNELLHYRPRMFNVGDLVWGQIKGFPPWPGQQVRNHVMEKSEHSKVEPEKLKTLTEDLEALDRATKRNRKGGKLNNHLEAAIHEAMSELDKMSGSVHQMPSRDRQVKPPKPKRRKISR